MDFDLVVANLLNPPVLFFFAGLLAVQLGSDLEVPQPLPKFFSLYLLLAIGFRGGTELAARPVDGEVARTLTAAVGMAVCVPFYAFFLLRSRLGTANAAAVAATYGSVSAVTFLAAVSLLGKVGVPFGGHMVAALALMESPAIVVAILLARRGHHSGNGRGGGLRWGKVLREAFLNGSVYLLVVSMLIGAVTGHEGEVALRPFTGDLFKGMLCLFLLDMGLVSSRRLGDLRKLGVAPIAFALFAPLGNAAAGIVLARALDVGVGDAFLLCVLCASASYIAVPAAIRLAIPEANPGVYVTMALAITFPANILLGLPLYLAVIKRWWG